MNGLPYPEAAPVSGSRLDHALDQAHRDSGSAAQMLLELAALGPRLTGSDGERRAADWALGQMRSIGLTNVHLEPWTMPLGWKRGHATARLLGPEPRSLDVCSFGWTGSTTGPTEGEVLTVSAAESPSGTDTPSGDPAWRGRILLVEHAADPLTSFFALPSLARRAQQSGALAVLVVDDRPGPAHASPLSFPGEVSSLPVLSLSAADAAVLAPLLRKQPHTASFTPPRVALEVSNSFTEGPVVSHNVVGEIRAAADPGSAETILLSAHLDSWDLSAGASDDAYGVAAVLAAAQAIVASDLPPRRTIRIVLFTGEEQGLLGSRAYVSRHAADLENLVCAIAVDWGDGPITKLPTAGHPELDGPLRASLSRVDGQLSGLQRAALPQGPAQPAVALATGYLTYTDAFAFTAAGIAGLAPLQDSPAYSRIGHSPDDTVENTNLSTLPGNVRVLTALCLGLADSPQRPALRWSPEQLQREMLRIRTPAGLLTPRRDQR